MLNPKDLLFSLHTLPSPPFSILLARLWIPLDAFRSFFPCSNGPQCSRCDPTWAQPPNPAQNVTPPPPTSLTHLIQLGLVTREGEGEAEGQLLLLDVQLLHEVGQALSDVVKELKGNG